MKRLIPSAAAAFVLCLAGCQSGEPIATAVQEQPQPPSTSEACLPIEELASLDRRAPVPLQPTMAWHQKQNMMQHLVAIQRVTDGLAREDWDEVARAAALIGSSPQMDQMCQHMGAGAEGFTKMALDFHRRADAIVDAARAHDGAAVLRATSNTLQSCTGCHATFRQEVVDAAEWQRRTAEAHHPG